MIFRNKKGLSGVVVTILLIALAIVLISVVWNVVDNLVNERLDQAGSCFGNFDKIDIGDRFTCYDFTNKLVRISVDRKDIELDGIIVSISNNLSSTSFILKNEPEIINNLWYSGSSSEEPVKVPDQNAARTYIYDWSDKIASEGAAPEAIQVAVIIGENQCEVSDTITDIISCSQLAS